MCCTAGVSEVITQHAAPRASVFLTRGFHHETVSTGTRARGAALTARIGCWLRSPLKGCFVFSLMGTNTTFSRQSKTLL